MNLKPLCGLALLLITMPLSARTTISAPPSCYYDGFYNIETVENIRTQRIGSSRSLLGHNIAVAYVRADLPALRSHLDHLKLLQEKNAADPTVPLWRFKTHNVSAMTRVGHEYPYAIIGSYGFQAIVGAADILDDLHWLKFAASELEDFEWPTGRRYEQATMHFNGTIYFNRVLHLYLTARIAFLTDDKKAFVKASQQMLRFLEKEMAHQLEIRKSGQEKTWEKMRERYPNAQIRELTKKEMASKKITPNRFPRFSSEQYKKEYIESLAKGYFLLGKLWAEGTQKEWTFNKDAAKSFKRADDLLNTNCSSRLKLLFHKVAWDMNPETRQPDRATRFFKLKGVQFSPVMELIYNSITEAK